MEILYAFVGLLIGLLFGFVIALLQQKAKIETLKKEYANEKNTMQETHRQSIEKAKNKSVSSSRSVLRGKVAEQFAPVLDGFEYSPSDARFLGDPIDYVVFNGYSNLRDNGGDEDELEVVIIDIKSGNARLHKQQKAIEKAVNAGRVRFETIQVSENGEIAKKGQKPVPAATPARPASEQDTLQIYARSNRNWGQKETEYVTEKYKQGESIKTLAETLQRNPLEVVEKLTALKLLTKKG